MDYSVFVLQIPGIFTGNSFIDSSGDFKSALHVHFFKIIPFLINVHSYFILLIFEKKIAVFSILFCSYFIEYLSSDSR